MRVADVMTHPVVTVEPKAPLKEVARVLAARQISGVPVVDESGHLLGVVSETDIVVRERGRERNRFDLFAWLLGDDEGRERRLFARTAADAMTTPAVTITPERPAFDAVVRMVDRDVNRLPVTTRDGTLVGIVTRGDLAQVFARGDEELEREIREDVLLSPFGLPIDVTVERGEVTLRGNVENEDVACAVPSPSSRYWASSRCGRNSPGDRLAASRPVARNRTP